MVMLYLLFLKFGVMIVCIRSGMVSFMIIVSVRRMVNRMLNIFLEKCFVLLMLFVLIFLVKRGMKVVLNVFLVNSWWKRFGSLKVV